MKYSTLFIAVVVVCLACVKPDPDPNGGCLVAPDSLWMEGATLFWSSVDYDSLDHYKVYKGRVSGSYGYPYRRLKVETSIIFEDLVEGVRYYTAVSAVDSGLRESEKSKEITFLWQDADTTDTTIDKQAIRLWWDPNSEADLMGYRVYRGMVSRDYIFCEDVGNVTEYIDSCAMGTYYWAVTAYDTAYNESDFSDEVTITVARGKKVSIGINKREPGEDLSDKHGGKRKITLE